MDEGLMKRSPLDDSIRQSVLTKSQREILRFLLTLHAKHNGAPLYPSVYKTASKLGITHNTARAAFARLVSLKVLRLVGSEAGGSSPRIYMLAEKAILALPEKPKRGTKIGGVKRSSPILRPPTPPILGGITTGESAQEKTALVLTLPRRGSA